MQHFFGGTVRDGLQGHRGFQTFHKCVDCGVGLAEDAPCALSGLGRKTNLTFAVLTAYFTLVFSTTLAEEEEVRITKRQRTGTL